MVLVISCGNDQGFNLKQFVHPFTVLPHVHDIINTSPIIKLSFFSSINLVTGVIGLWVSGKDMDCHHALMGKPKEIFEELTIL